MSETRAPSLRREVVLWYSLVVLIALSVFGLLAYLLLHQTLQRTGTATLRETALATERLIVPAQIPRLWTREQIMRSGPGGVETLRRRSQLVTGQTVDIFVARSDDVEARALRSFLLIALVLIPLTAAGAAWGGRTLAGRLLDPLSRLVAAVREIGIGGLSRRVEEPDRPAELQELAQSFNGMLLRLERAVDTLRRFTADASHELRTPLTSIRGTIQVALARPRTREELEETLAAVSEETEWMLHLVDGLLTLARGEEVGPHHAPQPVDLVPLLADVAEMGQALAGEKPLEVRLEAPESLVVPGAAGQLRQVFLNLVSNAVKFTEAGSVTIATRTVAGEAAPAPSGNGEAPAAAAADAWAEVTVTDTGVGIAPEELPRVFDRFYRGDAARSQPGGTGLGLAIARLMVEQHGGRIGVESAPRQGSTFRVLLPLRGPAEAPLALTGRESAGAGG